MPRSEQSGGEKTVLQRVFLGNPPPFLLQEALWPSWTISSKISKLRSYTVLQLHYIY